MTEPMAPAVSVIVPTHNRAHLIGETLQSILAQTFQDFEIIVVDNGSTDGTDRVVAALADPRIRYYWQEDTGVPADSRNAGVRMAQGKYVAFLDSDDLWRPEKLEKQLALFARRPEVGWGYSGAVVFISNDPAKAQPRRVRMYRGQVLVPLVLGNFVVCSSIMIRRDILDEVGGFNPEFTRADDYDLLLRIAEKYECDYVDEPLVALRVHSKNFSWDGFRLQSENITLLGRALRRMPWLARELGRNVTRLRRAGLPCRMGEAYLLQGHLRAAHGWYGSWGKVVRAVPRVAALYLLSFFSHSMIASLISVVFRVRKRKALRGS